MARLKLETTIQEGFRNLNTHDIREAGEALGRLSRNLDKLDAKGKITEEALGDMVSGNFALQDRIEEVVRISLSTQDLGIPAFKAGASSIVMRPDGSEIIALCHSPNDSPELEKYGNQLRWVLQHAAYATIAGAYCGTSPTDPNAYLAVENAIRISKGMGTVSRISDVPPASRHHLGGEWGTDQASAKDAVGTAVSATSGVLLSDYYLNKVKFDFSFNEADRQIVNSYRAAVQDGVLDGFDGNFLAGLNDAKVSRNLLNSLFYQAQVEPIDLADLLHLEAGIDAINLH
jgi:hypothetical protein